MGVLLITKQMLTKRPMPIQFSAPNNRGASNRSLKSILILGILSIPIGTANAKNLNIHCPGDSTVEMRYCAGVSLDQSSTTLMKVIGADQFQRWRDTTREMCAKAYAPYKEGTIFPQLAIGCEDHLNRALLKEFEPLFK